MTRILSILLLLCAAANGQTSQPSSTITFTDRIDLGGVVVNAQKLPKPRWDTTLIPPRWVGSVNLLETAATGDIVVQNGMLLDYEAGGAAIKFQALSNSITIRNMKFIGNGAYPFATPHPKGAGPWAAGVVAYTKRLNVIDCEIIACGMGSKFDEFLYPRADTVIVERCNFIGVGNIMQSPNLVTPESVPRLILKNCTFDGADFWNDDRGGWMGAVWFVNPKSLVVCENCTFTGKWRHIFAYLDDKRYIGRKNTFGPGLTFEDPAIAFASKYTLQQWLAMGTETDAVVVP